MVMQYKREREFDHRRLLGVKRMIIFSEENFDKNEIWNEVLRNLVILGCDHSSSDAATKTPNYY